MSKLSSFLNAALQMKFGISEASSIQRLRELARSFDIEPNPIGSDDSKTALPGTYRPIGTDKNGSCHKSCPYLHNGCYAEDGHYTGMSERRSGTDTERSVASAIIAMIIAARYYQKPCRLHVAGDFLKDNKIDTEYVRELRKATRTIRAFFQLDVVAYTYTHAPEREFKKHERALILDGIFIRPSDRNKPGCAIVWEHDAIEALRIAFPENKYIKCLNQVNKDITCAECQICWDARYKDAIVVFEPHGKSKEKIKRNLKVLQGV